MPMDAQKNTAIFVGNDGNSGYLEKESEYWNEYSRKRAGVLREGMGVPEGPPGGTDTLREGRPGKGLAFPGGICYI